MNKIVRLLKNPRTQRIILWLAPLVVSAITKRLAKKTKRRK